MDCSLLVIQSAIEKNSIQWKNLHDRQNDRELAKVTFVFLDNSRVKEYCRAKVRFGLLETQCILDQM